MFFTYNLFLISGLLLRFFLLFVILSFSLLNSLLLLLFELSKLILSHFLQFLLNFQAVLCCSNYTSLSHLLAILMVENHAHGMLEILKFFGINRFDLTVGYLGLFD
jgi:hypothetical protein